MINGPLYSTVTFVSSTFDGSLIDINSPNTPPGDLFIILLENKINVTVNKPLQKGDTNEENPTTFEMATGDVLYVPANYSHKVTVATDQNHAIVLCIVNRTPVLVREWGANLLKVCRHCISITCLPSHSYVGYFDSYLGPEYV